MKFEALQPGMLVEANVSGVLADGVKLVFGGYFEGTVSSECMGIASSQWPKRFPPGTKLPARLLWIHPQSKAVGLALSPHLTDCLSYDPPLQLGAPLKSTVEMVGKGGALVSVAAVSGGAEEDEDDEDDEEEGGNGKKKSKGASSSSSGGKQQLLPAYLAKSNVADLGQRQTAADALKKLKAGSSQSSVVVGYRYLEGLLDVSTRKSAASEERMVYDDVTVGGVYPATVAKIDGRGLRVRLARDLYGTVRKDHLTDKQLQRPLEKFKMGMKVKCLALESEPEREKLLLSLKEPLVESTLPRIRSYDDAKKGMTTHGVVHSLRPKSILIELLGGVTGIVKGSELKARFGALWESDPRSCYREGQVVECTVLTSEPKEKRILLTLMSAEEANAKPMAGLLQRNKRAAEWGRRRRKVGRGRRRGG